MARFEQVTIVGLGLIGGSLGMALRRRKLAQRVVGLSRSMSTMRRAKARGAVDAGTTSGRAAVEHSDLIVFATPVHRTVPMATSLARWMKPGAIVTDVGSTKAALVGALEPALARRRLAFVGAHPLAGSEQRGIDAARRDLFDGASVVVTRTARTQRQAAQIVSRLWRRLGCRIVTMSPQEHDRALAMLSHLPHALALCLIESLAPSPRIGLPRSFLEMSRIAKSDPGLWEAIFLTNRAPLLQAMRRFDRQWDALRRDLAGSRTSAIRRRLAAAKRRRDAHDDA